LTHAAEQLYLASDFNGLRNIRSERGNGKKIKSRREEESWIERNNENTT
jgi:hypothetical protein